MTAGAAAGLLLAGAILVVVAAAVAWWMRGRSVSNRDRERAAEAVEQARWDVERAGEDEAGRQQGLSDEELATDFDKRFGL